MRKVYLISVLFLLITISSAGQKIRFTDSSNRWQIVDGMIGPPPAEIYFAQYYLFDTTINSFNYRAFSPTTFVREDTINGKVYALGSFADQDSFHEELLMDYNLHVGDTIRHKYPHDSMVNVVTSIDSVNINGIWHKVWNMTYVSGNVLFEVGGYTVIEGIGSDGGPLYPLNPYEFENYFVMYCFSNSTGTPPLDHYVGRYHFNNTTSCHLAVNDVLPKRGSATVVPNPANADSKIVLPYPLSSGSLLVYNSIGQTIVNARLYAAAEYRIGQLPSDGLYFFKLIDGEKRVYFGRFLYHRY